MTTATRNEAAEPWYLGSLNDGLFIVDRPPSPADIPPDWGRGVGMVLNVVALTQERALAIVDAHNEALAAERRATVERIRAAVKSDPSDAPEDWVFVSKVDDILDEEAAR